MNNMYQEQETRRITILDGIHSGYGNSTIAAKLDVPVWVVKGDLKRMHYSKDPDLKQAYKTVQEKAEAEKQVIANKPDEKFFDMTGLTIEEKTFHNMVCFYEPELRKIMNSESESEAIRELSKSVRKTLKHNGILAQGWSAPELSKITRSILSRTPSLKD